MFNIKEEDFPAFARECERYAMNMATSLEGVRYDKGMYASCFLIAFAISVNCESREKAENAADLIADLIKSMINDAEERGSTYWTGFKAEDHTSH